MNKYKYTFLGMFVAGLLAILVTVFRSICDGYWRGWLSFFVLLFIDIIVGGLVGVIIDKLIVTHYSTK